MISDSVPTTYVRAENPRSEYLRPYQKSTLLKKKVWQKITSEGIAKKWCLSYLLSINRKKIRMVFSFWTSNFFHFETWIQRIFISPLWVLAKTHKGEMKILCIQVSKWKKLEVQNEKTMRIFFRFIESRYDKHHFFAIPSEVIFCHTFFFNNVDFW